MGNSSRTLYYKHVKRPEYIEKSGRPRHPRLLIEKIILFSDFAVSLFLPSFLLPSFQNTPNFLPKASTQNNIPSLFRVQTLLLLSICLKGPTFHTLVL